MGAAAPHASQLGLMDTEQDYGRYYRVLGLQPGCEWKAVRSAYRKKVAIWHPDRLPDIEGIRESAEAKFKDVSIAYQAISTYYHETGMMPEVGFFDIEEDLPPPMSATESVNDYDDYVPPPPRRQKRRRRLPMSWVVMGLLVIFFFVYLMSIQSWDQRSAADREAVLEQRAKVEASAASSRPSVIGQRLPPIGESNRDKGPRLRKGMSKDVVLSIQGEPILMTADTWDYGISKIYFRGEVVSGWYSSPLDPLRVE